MSNEHQDANSGEQSARIVQTAPLGAQSCRGALYIVIESLLGRPVARAALVSLFGGRATYDAIQHWRYGHASPPQWAIDLIRAQAEIRARALLRHAAAVGRITRTQTQAGREHANRINSRRQRERADREARP
jgi:hypothetical protein